MDQVVGHGLAQGVVINRPKRTPQIPFPSSAIGRLGLLRVPGMSGSLRLASFLGTQLLSPLARVLDALIQISLRGATPPLEAAPLRHVTSRTPRLMIQRDVPVQPLETKWPVLGSTPEPLLWGAVPQRNRRFFRG